MMTLNLNDNELQERVKGIARTAYENKIWNELACFNFMGCTFTESQINAWENIMAKAVRAKNKGGIKDIWI